MEELIPYEEALEQLIESDDFVEEYLIAALRSGDNDLFILALKNVLKARE